MDYHVLSTYTLQSMSKDIEVELKRLVPRMEQLKEQKEIIDMIILYRDDKIKQSKVDQTKQTI